MKEYKEPTVVNGEMESESQPGEDKPGEDKPSEDKPGEDKPSEDKPGEDKPSEDKPGEDKPSEPGNNGDDADIYKNCPMNDGKWVNIDGTAGERGESKWVPDKDYVPKKLNPKGKTWEEIMKEYDIDGIEFKKGDPNFSEISKANVEIDNFTSSRSDNFDQADIKLAKEWGCEPSKVAKWRSDNHYTWHECRDLKTMQLVPSEVHNNISHLGGISIKKGK